MPYARSGALCRFTSTVAPLKSVARASRTISCRYDQHVNPLRNAALSSTVLLGFAAFEEYIKQGVEEIFASAQANSVKVKKLPSSARAHVSIAAHLSRWSETESARLLTNIEAERISGNFSALVDESLIASRFSVLLLNGVKYPKPNNIRTLFKRLSVLNIFQQMDAIARVNTSNFLTSFHDARTSLAHQGIPPGWTATDFVTKLDELTVVAKALDRVLWNWTRQHLGAACWPR